MLKVCYIQNKVCYIQTLYGRGGEPFYPPLTILIFIYNINQGMYKMIYLNISLLYLAKL